MAAAAASSRPEPAAADIPVRGGRPTRHPAYDDLVSHPTADPAPFWEQPKIALGAPSPPDGDESESPMWTQPADAAGFWCRR